MKKIELTELFKYDFYVKNLICSHYIPRKEVSHYLYKNIPYNRFVYGFKGSAEYYSKDINIKILPKTLSYIPAGTTINFKEDYDYEYYMIEFNIYDADTDEEIIFSDIPVTVLDEATHEITNQIYEFTTIYSVNREAAKLKSLSIMYSFLYSIIAIKDSSITDSKNSVLSNALIYMNANYQHEFSTKDLADMCNISEQYFRKVFKAEMNMTPTEYKNLLRINRACNELSKNPVPISLLAEATGFNNIQYFCEIFKRITGYSPLQYRNNIKRGL